MQSPKRMRPFDVYEPGTTHSTKPSPLTASNFSSPTIPGASSALYRPYSLSPLSTTSQRLLKSCLAPKRRPLGSGRIPRNPYVILDAPDLLNDVYANVIDWSIHNVLGVGLGDSVHLWNWNALSSQVGAFHGGHPLVH